MRAVLAVDDEPDVRDCSTRAIGELSSTWRRRAMVAGPLAFVDMRRGYAVRIRARPGLAWQLKVLVVVEPRAVVTVTIARRSRDVAALVYSPKRHLPPGEVPLSLGATSVRFEACARPNPGQKPWNRATQFPGAFLVARSACVDVLVRPQGGKTMLRRLRFGVARCAR